MALSKTIERNGVTIANAYIRVSSYTGNKEGMEVSVGFHASNAQPAFSVSLYQCPLDLNGDNPIKQAYEHLKTLPEFAGAADV